MLEGIDPLLNGELLRHLDEMGHSDVIVIADAHFPARRMGVRYLETPGVTTPELVRAIRTVLPLDDGAAVLMMAAPTNEVLQIHHTLAAAARVEVDAIEFLGRFAFYDLAAKAYAVVRTGESRIYANVALRKGVVVPAPGS